MMSSRHSLLSSCRRERGCGGVIARGSRCLPCVTLTLDRVERKATGSGRAVELTAKGFTLAQIHDAERVRSLTFDRTTNVVDV
jgi:hypothetical protein